MAGTEILDLAARLGVVNLKPAAAGEWWAGPCPVCGGTARFAVNPRTGLWRCVGCGVGGGANEMVRHITGASWRGALAFVAGYHQTAPRRPQEPRWQAPAPQPQADEGNAKKLTTASPKGSPRR